MPQPRRRARTHDPRLTAGFAAVRAEHEVPVDLPPDALAEAAEVVRDGVLPTDGDRADRTALAMLTLDPPGSMDLDQAMHLERRGSGHRVRYAIADTAAVVRPGGAVDRAAHERVQTVYCPDLRVPLHPPALSEGASSLLPGQVRPAVLWSFDLDEAGEVTSVAVERALVRSAARLDYATEQARLDAGTGPDDPMALLAEVGARRAVLERARGGVSLAQPEQEVVERPDGSFGLDLRAPLPLEDHNAQISLMTGIAAARLMLEGGLGVLRTMPRADDDAVARLRNQARALGVAWPDGASYGDVLHALDRTTPQAAAFLDAATALFRGAAWTPFRGRPPADPEHGAIAAPYAHVTAPLRRLVDRYGLEVCLAVAAGRAVPAWVDDRLDALGETMATGARRASAVDRACTDLVEAALLESRVGDVLDGIALDEGTVQLDDPPVVARADGDLRPGARVRVRVVEADVGARSVRLERVA